jgi:hypothetical protein
MERPVDRRATNGIPPLIKFPRFILRRPSVDGRFFYVAAALTAFSKKGRIYFFAELNQEQLFSIMRANVLDSRF